MLVDGAGPDHLGLAEASRISGSELTSPNKSAQNNLKALSVCWFLCSQLESLALFERAMVLHG